MEKLREAMNGNEKHLYEKVQDIDIVGGRVAGLATTLAFHR